MIIIGVSGLSIRFLIVLVKVLFLPSRITGEVLSAGLLGSSKTNSVEQPAPVMALPEPRARIVPFARFTHSVLPLTWRRGFNSGMPKCLGSHSNSDVISRFLRATSLSSYDTYRTDEDGFRRNSQAIYIFTSSVLPMRGGALIIILL